MILATLALALTAPILRADILANSHFVDGRAHWKGDAKEINTADLSAGNVPGVTITLDRDKWTKLYQKFSTHEKTVNYSITFTLSSDYRISPDPTAETGGYSSQAPGLNDIEGMWPIYAWTRNGSWTLIVEEFGGRGYNHFNPKPDATKAGSQTITGTIGRLTEHVDKIIVLAFPPGEGTVTLTGLQLIPPSGDL